MAIGMTERRHCPLCEERQSRHLCEVPFENRQLREFLQGFYGGRVPLKRFKTATYSIVICESCGFIYQDRILNQQGMQALYLNWVDHDGSLQKKQRAQASLYRKYAGQLSTLSRVLPEPPSACRILDYGMGWGYWARVAQAHGYQVEGFELSQQRNAHARALGINTLDSLPDPGPHYDCIYANQVFEHLSEPKQALRELCDRLAPGGVVYLRVPDGRGVAEWLEQRGWSPELDAVHPFEHINCFTRQTLIALGNSVGLKPFNPPLRMGLDNLWGSFKREVADRFLTTHLLLRGS